MIITLNFALFLASPHASPVSYLFCTSSIKFNMNIFLLQWDALITHSLKLVIETKAFKKHL